MNCPIAIRKGSSEKVMRLTAQVKCLYTNAWSMGNKKEELKTTVQLENCDLIAVMETWGDGSHSWNASTEGYKLF